MLRGRVVTQMNPGLSRAHISGPPSAKDVLRPLGDYLTYGPQKHSL